MSDIVKLAQESNKEIVVVDGKPNNLEEFMAVNKILVPVRRIEGEQLIGFFKVHNGMLQVHTKTFNSKGEPAWQWFTVIDANEDQKARNRSLNMR